MEALSLRELALFLAVAGLLIPVLQRLHVPRVLGFLVAGLVIGPYALGRLADSGSGPLPWLQWFVLSDTAAVHALAEVGIVFLLFTIGLELSLARLWSMRRLVFGLGGAQIAVCGLAITLVARAFDNSLQAALVLGACLALSSTAIITQWLTERRRFGTPSGRGAFAVLLAQDLAVVPILFLVQAFGSGEQDSVLVPLVAALAQAGAAIALILGVGRIAIRPLFRFVARQGSRETFMAVTLLTIVATASITHATGLSAALGAFLAGLLLAETEFRHEIELDIEPFKGLLLGLFFMSVGMGIDLTEVAGRPLLIGASVIGLVVLKAAITAVLARMAGLSTGAAVEVGLLLGPGGEFAFVVVSLAAGLALLPTDTAQFMLIVVGGSMLINAPLASIATAVGERIDGGEPTLATADVPEPHTDHVVIAGYGRVGQLLAELLDSQQFRHVALDLDAGRVTRLASGGAPVYFGDASRPGMLERVHLADAAALVVTMNDADAAARVVRTARQLAPHVPIIARARDAEHAKELMSLGAMHAVPEVLEAGLQLATVLLEDIGLPGDATRSVIEARRQG